MGELKPLGSEKLSGDEKLKRILELTYYQSTDPKSESIEIIKETKTGVYGIVKEKDGYYVKRGLSESSLDYIGGLYMKNKNKFSSYSSALKKLEFLTEQEILTEATKYVLKQNKPEPMPQKEAPAPMPTNDVTPPTPDAGSPSVPSTETPSPSANDFGDEETSDTPENPEEYLKIVQKRTGKLTEKLNSYKDKLESEDIKYVLKMVMAALDLNKLSDSDEEEILSSFEDEESDENGETTPDFTAGDANAEPTGPQETEVAEVDGISALDELINTPFEDDNFSDFGDDDDDESDMNDIFNDSEISKAGKFAKKDIKKEFGNDESDFNQDMSDNDDEEFPLYKDDTDNIDDVDEMMSGESVEPMTKDEEVRELDLNELTDIVNSSVKETLSKYFS
jgi:hypothetical protein